MDRMDRYENSASSPRSVYEYSLSSGEKLNWSATILPLNERTSPEPCQRTGASRASSTMGSQSSAPKPANARQVSS